MSVVNFKYGVHGGNSGIFILALLLSLILHIILLFLLKHYDMIKIDLTSDKKEQYEDLMIIFPENKPRMVVENIHENNQIPEQSDLLSDKNSRARNEALLTERENQPASFGNSPFENLIDPKGFSSFLQNPGQKKFSKEALSGERGGVSSQRGYSYEENSDTPHQMAEQQSMDNIWEQKNFSADELGQLSLSTYAWEWAPYINALKQKLGRVWFAPPAYYMLGIIYGYTKIRFMISRRGVLLSYEVLEHQGHESLQISSVNAIKSLFPFKPLPQNFPEETLTITAILVYPNLRERRN
jgi:outer membrane biosynthesis protein TonB